MKRNRDALQIKLASTAAVLAAVLGLSVGMFLSEPVEGAEPPPTVQTR